MLYILFSIYLNSDFLFSTRYLNRNRLTSLVRALANTVAALFELTAVHLNIRQCSLIQMSAVLVRPKSGFSLSPFLYSFLLQPFISCRTASIFQSHSPSLTPTGRAREQRESESEGEMNQTGTELK